jgi:predicted nucleotidyltransferase
VAEVRISEVLKYLERCVAESGLAEARIVLFGSRARGAANDESDVDVAIVSPAFRGKDAFKRARLTKDVEIRAMRRFRLPFDIVTLTPEEYEGGAMIGDIIRSSSHASS